MKTKFLTVLIACLLGFGCTEEKEVKPLTYTKIFTGENEKTWVIEQVLVTKVGEADQSIDFIACELDDRYTFRADAERSYIVDNGASKCDVPDGEEPEGDVYVEHNWSFVNSGSTMTIAIPRVFGDFLIPFIVREVSENHMVLEIFANAESTISYKIIMRSVAEK